MRVLRVLGAVAASLLIIVALYKANNASTTARELTRASVENNYLRAVSACESSTELRSLLNDIGNIVVPPGVVSPRGEALIARIHRYTDHNPNCKHLPPKPEESK